MGLQDKIIIGNVNAKRDWGHAKDYVEMMWMMLQMDQPDDYVVATNETHEVREFVSLAFKAVDKDIVWEGGGVNEKGIDKLSGKVLVEVDPTYFRPTEVDLLIGDSTKAKNKLGWEPKIKFEDLVNEMVESDLKQT